MLEKNLNRGGSKKHDEVILFVRRHWISFLPWILTILVMIIAGIFCLVFIWQIFGSDLVVTYRDWVIIGSHAYVMLILTIFLTAWIGYYFDVTIITRTHLIVIKQEGFFNRKTSEQSLLRVQDVSARMKGILQTFFQFGAVFVETAGDAPNFEMENIPMPNRMANTILRLHDELITHGGREMEMAEGEGVLRSVGPLVKKPQETARSSPSQLEEEQVATTELASKQKEILSVSSNETPFVDTESTDEHIYYSKEEPSQSAPTSEPEEAPGTSFASEENIAEYQADEPNEQQNQEIDTNSEHTEEGELEEGQSIKLD